MRVPVCIQNRHIHLSQIDADRLFGRGYVFSNKKKLTQTGEFIAHEKLTIKGIDGMIENVDIVMPVRKFTQVEISGGDQKLLGINAPVLKSGDLRQAGDITIIGPKGSVYLPHCTIVAERHIHMSVADAKDFGLKNNQIVRCIIPWNGGLVIDNVRIRSNDKYVFDMHLNIGDGQQFGLKTGDWVEMKIK